MDRRNFTKSLLGATAGVALLEAISTGQAMAVPAASKSSGKYRTNLRFKRVKHQMLVSMRVAQSGQSTIAIPFQMIISKSRDMSNPIYSDMFYSNPRTSFCTRATLAAPKHEKLYLQIRLVDHPKLASKVWRLRRKKKNAA
ncbi:hypothetical protein [Xanthomonas sp. NCPPB 2632]|uniref:hypothetical protein n=1 Tax=Xanthomonas sp. NCPPB 2632 TaxID=3240912 RepID=UPI0035185BA2